MEDLMNSKWLDIYTEDDWQEDYICECGQEASFPPDTDVNMVRCDACGCIGRWEKTSIMD